MIKPTAQQLARQKLAATDLSKIAPPPPKRKKAEPEQTKYTKPAVRMIAEERKALMKAYAHAYYLAHKEEQKKRNEEYRKKNHEAYLSNSLQWYYDHKEHCNARNKEWRESHKKQKLESHRKWMAKHPGYYTKEQRQKRKEKRNGKGI